MTSKETGIPPNPSKKRKKEKKMKKKKKEMKVLNAQYVNKVCLKHPICNINGAKEFSLKFQVRKFPCLLTKMNSSSQEDNAALNPQKSRFILSVADRKVMQNVDRFMEA